MRVAVVGCGNAGPAVALALARQGRSVCIFERVPDPQPVGAGILLQPTGMTALAELGLLQAVAARGAPVHRLFGRAHSGRTVMDLAYADLVPGMFGLGIHRGVVAGLLLQAARDAGVQLLDGVDVVALAEDDGAWRLRDAGGHAHGPFDLVICADGARSVLRGPHGLTKRAAVYPWGALWFIGRDPERRYDGVLDQTYRDTRQMLGFLPSGTGPTGDVPLVSLFWSVPLADADTIRRRGLPALRDEILALQPAAAPLLDQVEDIDQLLLAPYLDVRMRRWHAARPGGPGLVFIGDAAHAMSPQLGQGTNLALLDAVVLARCLQGVQQLGLAQALAAYSAERRAHLRYYQLASRWLTPVFQSRLAWLGPLRDRLFAPLARVPALRRRMLDSLAGVRAGVFSTLPLSSFQAWRQVAPTAPGGAADDAGGTPTVRSR